MDDNAKENLNHAQDPRLKNECTNVDTGNPPLYLPFFFLFKAVYI